MLQQVLSVSCLSRGGRLLGRSDDTNVSGKRGVVGQAGVVLGPVLLVGPGRRPVATLLKGWRVVLQGMVGGHRVPRLLDRNGTRVRVVVELVRGQQALVDVDALPFVAIEGLRKVQLQLLVLAEHVVVPLCRLL